MISDLEFDFENVAPPGKPGENAAVSVGKATLLLPDTLFGSLKRAQAAGEAVSHIEVLEYVGELTGRAERTLLVSRVRLFNGHVEHTIRVLN